MRKIYNSKLLMFFLIFAFFKPICLKYISSFTIIDTLYDAYKIFSVLIIVISCILNSSLIVKIRKCFLSIMLLGCWIVIITYFQNGNVLRAVIDAVTISTIWLFVNQSLKINAKVFSNQLANVCFVIMIIQLISELLFPLGIPADIYLNNAYNPLYFYTLDNGTSLITIFSFTIIYLNNYLFKKGKKSVYFFKLFICVLTAFFSGSSTAIICMISMCIISIGIKEWKNQKLFKKPLFWGGIYFLIFIIIVLGGSNSIFSTVMKIITGKSGFTGRTFIWENALRMIKSSPIIGYGIPFDSFINVWGGKFSSHNVILEIMLQGGLIELFLWFRSIYLNVRMIRFSKDSTISLIVLTSIFITLISLMMEVAVFSVPLFFVVSISGNLQSVYEKYERR